MMHRDGIGSAVASHWLLCTVAAIAVMAVAVSLIVLLSDDASEFVAHRALADPAVDKSSVPMREFGGTRGVAVDSERNIYVLGDTDLAVAVFGPENEFLGEIRNSNEPRGIAVDSKGIVYIMESKTSDVVKYAPKAYPFEGHADYRGPKPVVVGGTAEAIAVDPYDDRLYVAEAGLVSVYDSSGTRGTDESQRVFPFEATGGTFTLSLKGERTEPLRFDAPHAEVEAALARLPSIGRGNVLVEQGPNGATDHTVVFTGELAGSDLPLLEGDSAGLRGGHLAYLYLEGLQNGFSGEIGKGLVRDPVGVGAYTSPGGGRYVVVADRAGFAADRLEVFRGPSVRTLRHLQTIDVSEGPAKGLDFGGDPAALGVDPSSGHFYVFDASRAMISEFESTGAYVARIDDSSFGDAEPAGIAVESSGGPDDGVVYVAERASSAVGLRTFGPLAPRRRSSLPDPSSAFPDACGAAVDAHGDIYVAGEIGIRVYGPDRGELAEIASADRPCDLAVDSKGNLYAAERGDREEGDEKVVMYAPDSYPLDASTRYGKPKTIASYRWMSGDGQPGWIAVDRTTDRLLLSATANSVAEYASAEAGSQLLRDRIGEETFGGGALLDGGLDVCEATGDIYIAGRVTAGVGVYVVRRDGTAILDIIDGVDSPEGVIPDHTNDIVVDQSNCHVLIANYRRAIEEYEASGAFVAEFGPRFLLKALAIDDGSSSPNRGNVYVATFSTDWLAFGPLEFGGR